MPETPSVCIYVSCTTAEPGREGQKSILGFLGRTEREGHGECMMEHWSLGDFHRTQRQDIVDGHV